MLKKAVLLGMILCCFIGCASHKMWYGDAKTGFRLRHQFSPDDSTIFLVKTTTTDSMKLMGKTRHSTTKINSFISHIFRSKLTTDQFQIAIKIDTVALESNDESLSPILLTQHDAFKGFLNQEMTTRVSKQGDVYVHSPIDSLLPTRLIPLLNPQHLIHLCYPRFNENGVKPGENWQTTNEYKRKTPNLDIKISCPKNQVIDKIISGDSTELMQIQTTGKYEISGQGRKLGILARIEGTGTIAGKYLFDFQKGHFQGGDFVEKIQFNYFFPGVENLPVSQTTLIKTSITIK